MVTVELPGLPTVTSLGNELVSMIRLNNSSLSTMSSSVMEILNEALVSPAENVTGYNPGV